MDEEDIIPQIMNLKDEEIDSWIEDRIELLERTAIEDRDEISTFSYNIRRYHGEKENTEVQGFIPSKTKLKKMQYDIASFRMDDISYYKSVIDYIKKATPEKIIKNGKINNNYIMNIVQCTILNYLGSYSSEIKRNELYDSKWDADSLSISDFKHNGTAMCVERSAMAQNILAFLGYNPMMIYGYLSSENGVVNDAHAYNFVIRNNGAILIDFTNPTMKDGKYYRPSMFSIDVDKLENFKKGNGQIEVTYKKLYTKEDHIKEEPIQVVYSSEEIDKNYFNNKKVSQKDTSIDSKKEQLDRLKELKEDYENQKQTNESENSYK